MFGRWSEPRPVRTRMVLTWEKGEHVGMGDLSLPWKPNTEEVYVLGSGFTGTRSLWQLTRRRINDRRTVIELADRTAEADVGRAHTDFVANASHELRTPLASIIGYVETLSDGGTSIDADTSRRFLDIVQREAKRMLSLVEDLMTLSHVEAEKHERPATPLDLGQLAARVVGEVSSLRGKERVSLAPPPAAPPGGLVVAGDTRDYQAWYRDAVVFCTSSTYNLTNAVEVTWVP